MKITISNTYLANVQASTKIWMRLEMGITCNKGRHIKKTFWKFIKILRKNDALWLVLIFQDILFYG